MRRSSAAPSGSFLFEATPRLRRTPFQFLDQRGREWRRVAGLSVRLREGAQRDAQRRRPSACSVDRWGTSPASRGPLISSRIVYRAGV